MSSESQNNVSTPQNTEQNALQNAWGWFLGLGIAMVFVGTAAIVFSGIATLAMTFVLGWLLIIGGIAQGVHSFFARQWGGFFMQILAAFLYLVVGVMLLANPIGGVVTLTLLITVFFAFEGAFKILTAFQMRPTENWGWVLFSGILAFVLAGIIWAGWPGDAIWVVGLLVGVNILFSGWATIMLALGAKGDTCSWCSSGNQKMNPSN